MTLVAGVHASVLRTTIEVRELGSGTVVARSSQPHQVGSPPPEHQPDVWWSGFDAAWADLGSPSVAALSVVGPMHGLVVLDEAGDELRPEKPWDEIDTVADAGWLCTRLPGGPSDWAAAVGSVPTAAHTIAKLSWLHRSEAEMWAQVARVLAPHDWLTHRLTGEFVTDRGGASGTGYWSAGSGTYRFDLLAIVDRHRDWTDVVPRVAAPTEVVGEWRGATVTCGTGEPMAMALGLGLVEGAAVVSPDAVFTVADTAPSDASGVVSGFADATGRYLPLVRTDAVQGASAALETLHAIVPLTQVVLARGLEASLPGGLLPSALDGLPVRWAAVEEPATAGACVQAAAVASASGHAEVVEAWGFGRHTAVPGG